MKHYILTPKAPDYPRINNSGAFGVNPGSPFLYKIAVVSNQFVFCNRTS